jgi:hypothetical protein
MRGLHFEVKYRLVDNDYTAYTVQGHRLTHCIALLSEIKISMQPMALYVMCDYAELVVFAIEIFDRSL